MPPGLDWAAFFLGIRMSPSVHGWAKRLVASPLFPGLMLLAAGLVVMALVAVFR
jgi:hypothetical protein